MIITSTKLQKKNGGRISVFLDGEFFVGMPLDEFVKLKLKIGDVLDNGAAEDVRHRAHVADAKQQAVRLLARKMYTKQETVAKLLQKGCGAQASAEAVDYLAENGYIDDEKYAKMYVKDSIKIKKSGAKKVEFELRMRGISQDIIQDAMSGFDNLDTLRQLISKKASVYEYLGPFEVKKIKNYCYSRGFSLYDIERCMSEAGISAY